MTVLEQHTANLDALLRRRLTLTPRRSPMQRGRVQRYDPTPMTIEGSQDDALGMDLAAGSRFGNYEVVRKLGEGAPSTHPASTAQHPRPRAQHNVPAFLRRVIPSLGGHRPRAR